MLLRKRHFYNLFYGSVEAFYILTSGCCEVGSATAATLDELCGFANEIACVEALICNEIFGNHYRKKGFAFVACAEHAEHIVGHHS